MRLHGREIIQDFATRAFQKRERCVYLFALNNDERCATTRGDDQETRRFAAVVGGKSFCPGLETRRTQCTIEITRKLFRHY